MFIQLVYFGIISVDVGVLKCAAVWEQAYDISMVRFGIPHNSPYIESW